MTTYVAPVSEPVARRSYPTKTVTAAVIWLLLLYPVWLVVAFGSLQAEGEGNVLLLASVGLFPLAHLGAIVSLIRWAKTRRTRLLVAAFLLPLLAIVAVVLTLAIVQA